MAWGQYDTIRGGGFNLDSASNDAQGNYNTHPNGDLGMAFTATGYTTPPLVNNNVNNSVDNYVNYFWKAGGTPSINTDGSITSLLSANQAAGFSVVKYTGNGTTGATFGHGLSQVPQLMFSKRTDTGDNWNVYTETTGNTGILYLNLADAFTTVSNRFNNTSPTSTVFTLGNSNAINANNGTYIAYCFTSISGYSKVGTYSGTASANSITTGFEPGFIIIKRTDNTGNWVVMDSARGMGSNAYALFPNASSLQSNGWNTAFTATGFTISSAEAWINGSGGTYIYLAIKEN
jgi:hypothetical protein